MNGGMVNFKETVPARPPRNVDDMMRDIAELRAEAKAGGYGHLAHFLGMALMEAEIQSEREATIRNAPEVSSRSAV
jgi:hypothetical protein